MAVVNFLGAFSRRFQRCPSTNLQETSLQQGLYPEIWMPQEYALAMYWRVKKWRFSFDAQWAETAGSVNYEWSVSREFGVGQASLLIQDQNWDPENEQQGPIFDVENILTQEINENESKLVCGVDPSIYELIETPDFGDPFTYEVVVDSHFSCESRARVLHIEGGSAATRVNASIDWSFGNRTAAYIRENDGTIEMLPAIRFDASTSRWTLIRAYNWTALSEPPLGTYGTFSYILLGKTFSVPIYAYNTRSNVSGFINKLNVSASLEAKEYWAYDPNDGGGPIYDTETGEQLRSFP